MRFEIPRDVGDHLVRARQRPSVRQHEGCRRGGTNEGRVFPFVDDGNSPAIGERMAVSLPDAPRNRCRCRRQAQQKPAVAEFEGTPAIEIARKVGIVIEIRPRHAVEIRRVEQDGHAGQDVAQEQRIPPAGVNHDDIRAKPAGPRQRKHRAGGCLPVQDRSLERAQIGGRP